MYVFVLETSTWNIIVSQGLNELKALITNAKGQGVKYNQLEIQENHTSSFSG